jgi:hypothetical protein
MDEKVDGYVKPNDTVTWIKDNLPDRAKDNYSFRREHSLLQSSFNTNYEPGIDITLSRLVLSNYLIDDHKRNL